MKKVAIIHPWFPRYRIEFFERVIHEAKKADVDVQIFHGDPPPEWQARGDAVSTDWAFRLPTRFFGVGSKKLAIKQLKTVHEQGPFDLYILEHAIRSLETYRLMAASPGNIAFWGHGRTYTRSVPRAQERLKQLLLTKSQWYFAYTTGGAKAVRQSGFDPQRITVVENAIDSNSLKSSINDVTDAEISDFKRSYAITGPCALFLGGLDSSKRLPFLLEACERTFAKVPSFKLLVSGDGDQRELIENAAREKPWLKFIGPSFGSSKAIALQVADVLCMPGRVGLIAVDSFAASRPIVTTDWPYHAPEFEYLENGVNAIVTVDSTEVYGNELAKLLLDNKRIFALQEACSQSSDRYTVENMVYNFVDGIVSCVRGDKF